MKEIVELLQRVASLERVVAHQFRHGPVNEVDAAKQKVRMQIGGTDQEPLLGPWIPYGQIAGGLKVHTPPTVGQQMTMLSPSGDYRQAVAMPMTWSDQNASPSQKGDENVITYGGARITLDGDKLQIDKGGVTVRITGSNVDITATDIRVKGNVEVDGDFKAKGGTFEHEGVFVGDDHVHTKVEPGGALSGPPPGG